MPKFIINPGTPSAWELQLQPGTIRLGRDAANDVQIDASTVSGTHCAITVTGNRVAVKDLGSTNGTFINGAPVQEATLEAGQTLHLGGVEMAFQADQPAPATAAPPPPVRVSLHRAESSSAPPPTPPPASDSISCPGCGNSLAPRAILCTKCGYNLRTGQRMPSFGTAGGPRARSAPTPAGPDKWWQTPGFYAGVFGGILLLLYILARFHPAGALAFLAVQALYSLVVHILVIVAAFKEDAGTGFMTLCIPFYAIFFVFSKSESPMLKALYSVALLGNIASYTLKGID